MHLGPKNGKLIYFITSLKHPRLHFTHRISRLKQEKWQTRSLIGKILDHFQGIWFCNFFFLSPFIEVKAGELTDKIIDWTNPPIIDDFLRFLVLQFGFGGENWRSDRPDQSRSPIGPPPYQSSHDRWFSGGAPVCSPCLVLNRYT